MVMVLVMAGSAVVRRDGLHARGADIEVDGVIAAVGTDRNRVAGVGAAVDRCDGFPERHLAIGRDGVSRAGHGDDGCVCLKRECGDQTENGRRMTQEDSGS